MGKKVVRNSSVLNENSITAEELFTDREEPRKAFWDIYDSLGESEYEVLAFYGVGGVGKSTLLKKLGREIEEEVKNGKLDYVYYSFECEPTKEEFLYSLSRKMMMRNKGLSFPVLDTAIAKLAEEGKKDLALLEEKGQSIFESEYAQLAASVAGEYLPWVGTITQAAGSVVKIGNKIKSDWEKEKGANRNVYSDIAYNDGKRAIENLHEYFVKDVFDVFEKRTKPFVIFLDGYEHFVNRVKDGDKAELVDHWMYNEDNGLIYIPNTIWVISGRNAINWPEDVLTRDNSHRIGDLSEEDTLLFFKKAGINDDELAKGLYKITGGTPAFLDLCVKRYNTVVTRKNPEIGDFGHNTETLAQRYLESMDSSKQAVIKMISCFPNIWTSDMAIEIAEILGYGNVKIILDDILPLSIFEKYAEGYRLHETVRRVVKDNTKNSQEIDVEILKYIKDSLLGEKKCNRISYITYFCEYLSYDEIGSISQADVIDILNILQNEKDSSCLYEWCDNCIDAILSYAKKKEYDISNILKMRNVRALNYCDSGNYLRAKEYCAESYENYSVMLKDTDPLYIDTLKLYALALRDCGLYDEALEMHTKCCSILKEEKGEKSLEVLYVLSDISIDYYFMTQIDRSISISKECYQLSKELLGEYNDYTLKFMNDLAMHLCSDGQLDEAVSYAERGYEIRKEFKGDEHPDTMRSLFALAMTYLELGRKKEALASIMFIYQCMQKVYGDEHPETLRSWHNVALYMGFNEMYEEALAVDEKCYELRTKVLGTKHPDTIESLFDLYLDYLHLEKYEEALKMIKECYGRRVKVLGQKHPDTLDCMHLLASCYVLNNDYNIAIELLKDCYALRKEVLGEHHPDTEACAEDIEIYSKLLE